MRIIREVILDTVDGTQDQISLHGLLAHTFGFSIQLLITGTIAGSVKLQGSDDPVPDSNFLATTMTVTNWTDIVGSTQSITGAGTLTYNVSDSMFNFVRVIYTYGSGTGTITAIFNGKGF